MTRNESAGRSLDEGLEEALHRLGVIDTFGISPRATNYIESINSLIEQRTGKVDYWKTSNQRQRWLATALLTSRHDSGTSEDASIYRCYVRRRERR